MYKLGYVDMIYILCNISVGMMSYFCKNVCTATFKNKWYNEECKFAIEEMKKAREKWLIKGRREKEEQEHHHKRKEAHKIIRNKKKTYMENVTD